MSKIEPIESKSTAISADIDTFIAEMFKSSTARSSEDLTDLCSSSAPMDARHQPSELAGIRDPTRTAAFGEVAVVD